MRAFYQRYFLSCQEWRVIPHGEWVPSPWTTSPLFRILTKLMEWATVWKGKRFAFRFLLVYDQFILDNREVAVSLHEKSKENMDLIRSCVRREKNYNAVAGRAYYAVFQRLKHVLESEGFDYAAFLQRSNSSDRAYSHGTIVRAFMDHVSTRRKRTALVDMQRLMSIDALYIMRRRSDYESGYEVSKPNLERYLSMTEDILSAIERLDKEGMTA
jgi:uncharacterized protein (UPF0332 family)